jgi:hypothetical protein
MGGGGPIIPSDSFFTSHGISVNEIRPNNPEKELIIGDNESSIRSDGGRVINYAHTVFHGTFSKTSSLTTATEVLGLRTVMQRKYDHSDILCQWNLHIGGSYYQIAGNLIFENKASVTYVEPNDNEAAGSFSYNNVTNSQGTSVGLRPQTTFNTINYIKGTVNTVYSSFNENGSYLIPASLLGKNSQSTAILATIEIRGYSDSYPVYINRTHTDSDSYNRGRPISTFTMFEIAYND